MSNENQQQPPADNEPKGIARILTAANVRANFESMLGSKAQNFITSVLQAVDSNNDLKQAEPMSIYFAAATAATMDLPITPSLGFAHIVPYGGKAQFQMGYKGYIQLGLRTGQYEKMTALVIYKNEFVSWNRVTEELVIDHEKEGEGEVHGYYFCFKLKGGFWKAVYWTKKKVEQHAQQYSKSYNNPKGRWKNGFDDMALKTVIALGLRKWGILSIEMQLALKVDQAVILDEKGDKVEYIDNPEGQADHKGKANAALDATKKLIGNKS